jgi:hypothetical protein
MAVLFPFDTSFYNEMLCICVLASYKKKASRMLAFHFLEIAVSHEIIVYRSCDIPAFPNGPYHQRLTTSGIPCRKDFFVLGLKIVCGNVASVIL